jgi:hypothetical protein
VAELASPGLTELAIGLENKGALIVRPRGRPSEGRAGYQRDQRETLLICCFVVVVQKFAFAPGIVTRELFVQRVSRN